MKYSPKQLMRQKMKAFGDSTTDLADYLGIATITAYAKIDDPRTFKRSEVIAIKYRYQLTDKDCIDIFDKTV